MVPDAKPPHVSALFGYIASLHGDRPWGSMLDAGAGVKSLQWIRTLPTDSWTAITAAPGMADSVRAALGEAIRPQDRLLVGNWIDDDLLAGETFDTVLVDYLVGAIEGFAPYWQDRAFERLRPLVADDGRLYVTGLEPYVPYRPETESGRIIWEIGRVRDACLLLAGERPYREYPLEWMLRHLEQAGFEVVESRRFPIRYGPRHINGQLDMCRRRLQRFGSTDLAGSMLRYVEELRLRALAVYFREAGLRHGHDYVIAARPRS
ncbi:class I SAM-dependent methyltransferase [[Mycobacterium] kokjensenii]|uniref:Class I SAM-dependent methyltransferase n=1 Tax=[Mycobacterium] kokjensenii TaxID=3064287 RepID=A0ABM9LUD3_9MYCO|nr:class I SAM-dependent methyltransferase [Mycolicibacter sp. MU0083]